MLRKGIVFTDLKVAENGKFAVITNYRDVVQTDKSNLKSRGNLTLSYLSSDIGENDYAEILRETAKDYAGETPS